MSDTSAYTAAAHSAAGRSPWPATVASVAVVLVLGGFIFFYGLGRSPLVMWDEARLAVNALEMAESGDLITTRYAGHPDLWNTKPPLVIWAMAGSIKLLGPTEFAVRLPSALAGLSAALLLLLFCARFLRDPLAGLASALVLLTSVGFVGEHVTRTGDYDAHLALWTTAYRSPFLSPWMATPPEYGGGHSVWLVPPLPSPSSRRAWRRSWGCQASSCTRSDDAA